MNLERAMARRVDLDRRLSRAAAFDFTRPVSTRRPDCPEAIDGRHGAPNTSGNCPYCARHLGRAAVAFRAQPNADFDDRIDPLTLEPLDPHERP